MSDQIFFYSIVQIFPDPVRAEGINVGIILVDDAGSVSDAMFASLRRARALGSPLQELEIQRFIRSVQARLGPDPGLFPSERPAMDEAVLSAWSRNFGGQVRLTPPRFASGGSLSDVLTRLYARYVGQRPTKRHIDRTGTVLLSRFDQTIRHVQLDGSTLTSTTDPVQGHTATHTLDRVIFTASTRQVAGAAHAISFSRTDPADILADRAVVIVAAEDLHRRLPDLPVFALLGGGNDPDRSRLADETRGLLQERDVEAVTLDQMQTIGNVLLRRWRQPALLD